MEKSKVAGTIDKSNEDAVHQWLLDNYYWLTEWLTNIVTISEVEAIQTKSPFQTFEVPLRINPPHGILLAGNELKAMLIMQAVF